jgi:hypothetical protein
MSFRVRTRLPPKSYTGRGSPVVQCWGPFMALPFRSAGKRVETALFCALLLCSATTTLVAAEGLRIVPLVRDDHVLVTFELADGFTEEVRAAVRSGLKTTFTYTVDLRLEVPVWVDRTIVTSTVTNSVEYDNLTRLHTVVRMVDGKVESTQVLESEAAVRQLMTSFQRLPLFETSVLEPNREYYVRISATARPTNGAFLWPWGSGTSGQAKFTFVR